MKDPNINAGLLEAAQIAAAMAHSQKSQCHNVALVYCPYMKATPYGHGAVFMNADNGETTIEWVWTPKKEQPKNVFCTGLIFIEWLKPMKPQRPRLANEIDEIPMAASLTEHEIEQALAQATSVHLDRSIHPTATVSKGVPGITKVINERLKRADLPTFKKGACFKGVSID